MNTRREFIEDTVAGIAFVGCGLLSASPAYAQAHRLSVPVDEDLRGSHPGHSGLSDEERVAMLGGTAAKLLGIKA